MTDGDESVEATTIYTSTHVPDVASALDVLAFVLTPVAAFANSDDPEEVAVVAAMFGQAKAEAVERWLATREPADRKRQGISLDHMLS